MNKADPNPYESPQTVTTEPRVSLTTSFLRVLLRLTTLAFTGFASFFIVAMLFVVANENASITWAIGISTLGAVLFVSTELFNSGKGREAGFIGRLVASIAVFLLSIVISASVGPRPQLRSEETDPYWLQRDLIFAAALVSTFAIARLIWIGHRDAKDFDHTV